MKVVVRTRPDRASQQDPTGTPSPGTLLRALGVPVRDTVWLDRDQNAGRDIEAYVTRRLLETVGSRYAAQEGPATAAARVIARRSDRVFLIARLLTLRPGTGRGRYTEAHLTLVVANAGAYLIESGEDGQTRDATLVLGTELGFGLRR